MNISITGGSRRFSRLAFISGWSACSLLWHISCWSCHVTPGWPRADIALLSWVPRIRRTDCFISPCTVNNIFAVVLWFPLLHHSYVYSKEKWTRSCEKFSYILPCVLIGKLTAFQSMPTSKMTLQCSRRFFGRAQQMTQYGSTASSCVSCNNTSKIPALWFRRPKNNWISGVFTQKRDIHRRILLQAIHRLRKYQYDCSYMGLWFCLACKTLYQLAQISIGTSHHDLLE